MQGCHIIDDYLDTMVEDIYDLVVPYNLFTGQSIFVGQDVTIDNDLFVRDDAIIDGDLLVREVSRLNTTVINGSFISNDTSTFNYITTINSNLYVTGNTHLQGPTIIENIGDFIASRDGLFQIDRRATFNAGFNAELASTADDLTVQGTFNSGTPTKPGSATFFGPVAFAVCPTFPPGCMLPLPMDTSIVEVYPYRSIDTILDGRISLHLSNDNRGKLIDATEHRIHEIRIEDDISLGSEWEIYLSSDREILIFNHTSRMISVSGFVQEDGDTIFVPRSRDYTYAPMDRITCMEPSDIQNAYYKITVTYLDDIDIRVIFHAMFA